MQSHESPDPDNFWTDLAHGVLTVQSCDDCGHTWAVASPRCPYCASFEVVAVQSSRFGRIYSWVVTHHGFHPELSDLPYTVVLVELEGGARVLARIRDDGDTLLGAGDRVELFSVEGATPPMLWCKVLQTRGEANGN